MGIDNPAATPTLAEVLLKGNTDGGTGAIFSGSLLSTGTAGGASSGAQNSGVDAALKFNNTGTGGREYWWDSGALGSGVGEGAFAAWDNTSSRLLGWFDATGNGNFTINGWMHAKAAAYTYATPGVRTPATTSAFVMAGANTTYTPNFSGRVRLRIFGTMEPQSTGSACGLNLIAAYGTGAPPVSNAAQTGTQIGNQAVSGWPATTASLSSPFFCGGVVTGLTLGTAYWFDLQLYATGVAGSVLDWVVEAEEF